MNRRHALLLVVVGVLAAAAWVLAGVKRVPGGTVLVVRGDPASVRTEGWTFVSPGREQRRFSPDESGGWERSLRFESAAHADYRLFDRDRREVEVDASLRYEPDARFPFARVLGSEPPARLEEILEDSLRTALRRHASARTAEELTSSDLATSFSTDIDLGRVHGAWRFAPAEWERRARAAASSTGRRVLLIGADALDWSILAPLLDRGELPHLARMIERGASGPLASITPLLSPLIWTTIATGVSPERHGVLDFVKRTDDGRTVPVGSADRRVPAIWNLVGGYGKSVSVVAWLATYPAEPIEGTMVTDRFGFLPFADLYDANPADAGMVWPEGFLADAAERRMRPEDLDLSLAADFVTLPGDSIRRSLGDGYRPGRPVNNLLHTLAATETTRRLSRWLWERDRPDLGLFYFEMVDAVGHLFMPYAPPRLPWVEEAEFAAYRGAIDASYRYQDRIVGELLSGTGDSTLVVVVSDHGFKSGKARLRESSEIGTAAAARWHLPDGVILLMGDGVRPGHGIEGARVHDVAPTVLAYLGIAPPGDMEGRVLREAFGIDLPARLDDPDRKPEPLSLDLQHAAASTSNNLGLRQLGAGKVEEAVASFRAALRKDPDLMTARNNLANALLRLGKFEESRRELEAVLERDPEYALGWMNLGLCLMRMEKAEEAVSALGRARDLEPRDPRILRNLGFAALEARDFAAARDAFREAVSLEEHAAARFGHGVALHELGDQGGARRELERALELDPGHERARRALESLGPAG